MRTIDRPRGRSDNCIRTIDCPRSRLNNCMHTIDRPGCRSEILSENDPYFNFMADDRAVNKGRSERINDRSSGNNYL